MQVWLFSIFLALFAQGSRPKPAADSLPLPTLLQMKLTVSKVMDRYVEPARIQPSRMLLSGLESMAREVPEIMVRQERKNVVVEVGSEKLVLKATVPSAWDLLAAFNRVFTFLAPLLPEDVNLQKVEHAAISGILETLDPHSSFMPPDQFREMRLQTRGSFGGLGIVVSICDQKLSVIKVMENTPAARVGLKPGDRILRIGNQPTENLTLNESVSRLRGDPGDPVSIMVSRESWKRPRTLSITREAISFESVSHRILEHSGAKYGYIKVKAFQMPTGVMVRQALLEMNKAGVNGLVLDLRGNGGGLLHIAIEIGKFFMDSGIIVAQVSKNTRDRREERADAQSTIFKKPVVVLVDDNSASASEIVAGTLKYSGRGILIGKRTFGKGSVQDLIDFPGDTALKLTIAQYLTYGDVSIQGVGIVPDVELHHVRMDAKNRIRPVTYYTAGREAVSESMLKSTLDAARVTPMGKSLYSVYAMAPEPKTPPFICNYCGMDPDDVQASASDPDEFVEDAAVDLAREILASFKGTFVARPAALPRIKSVVDRFQVRADAEIARKVASQFAINWKLDESVDPKLEATLKVSGPAHAGRSATVEVEVRNTGKNPVYRLRGQMISSNPRMDYQEVLFGLIKPGETMRRTMEMRIPSGISSRTDTLRLQLYSHMQDLGTAATGQIAITGSPQPRLELAMRFADSGGKQMEVDGVLEAGETGVFHVIVTNAGDGPTGDANLVLKNMTGEEVQLISTRGDLRNLAPGQKREFAFEIKAQQESGEPEWRFVLEARDCNFGTHIEIPWLVRRKDGKLPPSTAVSGWFHLTREAQLHDTPWEKTRKLVGVAPKDSVFRAAREIDGKIQVFSEGSKLPLYVDGTAGQIRKTGKKLFRLQEIRAYTPPAIQLREGTRLLTGKEQEVTVAGEVSDADGLRDLYLSVTNTKSNVYSKKVAYKAFGPGIARSEFSRTVPVWPGVNIITVTARDLSRATDSRNLVIVVE